MSRLKSYNIEYANFLCHFGEQVLLDRYIDLFYPAMTSGDIRTYGDTSFSFSEVKHIELEDPESGQKEYFLYGKMIKDFIYKRDQLLDHEDNQLKQDHDELRDSPSSTFILSLKDHRLYFIKEFLLGPTLDNFKTLVEKLIQKYILNLIDDEHSSKKEMSSLNGGTIKVPTKKSLRINYPDPEIKIVKLSSPDGVVEFIRSIKTIESFELQINKTNHEGDLSSLFRVLREQNKQMGVGASNKIIYTKGKKSLNHGNVTELAKVASEDNNINFKVKGKGIDGEPMQGTEEEFTVKMPISEIEETPSLMTQKAYNTFWKLVKDGVVSQPRINKVSEVREKIKHIIELFGL
jgi:hypothetical protein